MKKVLPVAGKTKQEMRWVGDFPDTEEGNLFIYSGLELWTPMCFTEGKGEW
jgi:hypothetical protein